VARCFGDGDPLYEDYHDNEWGHPVTGEQELFERLVLESFQSGLAWITILRKREHFRAAFRGFDIGAVAAFDATDVERLLQDAGIVRNRAKIEAAITNARATQALHADGGSLRELLWTDDEPAVVAKRLKSLGFRFLGPTTVESAMQACGVIDGHGPGCASRRG
jgi:DNA-3-methyladenine glycosylase I